MTIVVDDLKNIQRIVDVINSNPSILRQNNTDGLLRSVQVGNPAQMVFNNPEVNGMPYAYVTTSDSLQKTSYSFGISSSSSLSQITVEYKIVIVSDSKDRQVTAEKKLYNLLTLMRTILTSDPTFKDPDSDDDPIFTRSIVNTSRWNTKTKGTLVQIVEFTLSATIGSLFSVDFPDIGNVILLSKPNNPEGVIFSENRLQADPNRVITPNGDTGSLFIEYESTSTLDDAFRAKFGTQETITINTGTSSRKVDVVYIEINSTAQFDAIERTILHMEIVKI